MNISSFYIDLASYVESVLPADWKVFAEKIENSFIKTCILNVTDSKRSPDTGVYSIECEFILTDSVYADLALQTKAVQDAIHRYRGIFATVGSSTRAYVHESVHGVRIKEDRSEGKIIDLPHLRFMAMFFIETA